MAMAAYCIWLSKITGGDPAITLWHMPSQIGKVQTASPKLYTFKLQAVLHSKVYQKLRGQSQSWCLASGTTVRVLPEDLLTIRCIECHHLKRALPLCRARK